MDFVTTVNSNRIFWGVTMLLLNTGSRYVLGDLGKFHENILANAIMKKIILFSMFFVATRDVITSFVMTVLYLIVIDGLLHEKRKFSLVKNARVAIDSVPSTQEYTKAKEIVASYDKAMNNAIKGRSEKYDIYLSNLAALNYAA